MSSPPSQLENTASVLPLSIPTPAPADPPLHTIAASSHAAWPDRGHVSGPAPDAGSDMAADADICAARGPAAEHVQTSLLLPGSEVPSASASAPPLVSALFPVPAPAPAAQTAPASPSAAQDLLSAPVEGHQQLPPGGTDQNKKPRGPALQRPRGPSLLTQALASARGILPSLSISSPGGAAQPDPTRSSSQPQTQGTPSPSGSCLHTSASKQLDGSSALPKVAISHKDVRGDAPPQGEDAGSLTASQARFVPHSPAMPASTIVSAVTVSASSLASPMNKLYPTLGHNGIDFGGVDPRTWVHQGLRPQNPHRGTSLEELDRESRRPAQGPVTPANTAPAAEKTTPASTNPPPRVPNQQRSAQGEDPSGAPETRSSQRPRNVEHRVSMGPEKIWSIGSGERDSLRDGQVEKSVTEVLSGIEHNNRSRKASHSLGFFKEGLPEEKTKKKESSRHGGHARDALSPQLETIPQAEHADHDQGDKQPGPHKSPRDLGTGFADLSEATRSPVLADLGRTRLGSDHFGQGQAIDKTPTLQDSAARRHDGSKAEDYALLPEPAIIATEQGHERRLSGDSTATAGSGEDGEDSSEEKISSAVFVPHQAPQEPPGTAPTAPANLQRQPQGQRTAPRGDDWLVKADEPEADRHEEEEQSSSRPSQSRDLPSLRSEASETEYAQTKRPTDEPVASYFDPRNHVQAQAPPHLDGLAAEEQPPPEPPLEAIELIPYKHQVGGHTTLWRFSKRAVCKQLNNRENEFYERIERDVGDLLAFLPRYIGVLNVTFHKQPRRKSMLKREDAAALERKLIDQPASNGTLGSNGSAVQHEDQAKAPESAKAMPAHHRVISQSLQSSQIPVPTVTFVDNQHILPRHLLQPSPKPAIPAQASRFRSSSAVALSSDGQDGPEEGLVHRPTLEDRHANSWGATTVNKRLRNEVFNDVFLKHPVPMRPHRRAQRTFPRSSLPNFLRPSTSDAHIPVPKTMTIERADSDPDRPSMGGRGLIEHRRFSVRPKGHSIDVTMGVCQAADDGQESSQEKKEDCIPPDITGTSAPEPEIFGEKVPGKRRRYSGSGLRRRADQDLESRGNLQYFQGPDDEHFKSEAAAQADVGAPQPERENGSRQASTEATDAWAVSTYHSSVTSGAASPSAELTRIPRPINPKEAQTQRDSRVEYFLLLEDLTAGMKRPCIMDLKMGTRQYGVDANLKKQQSQHRKCAGTTSRELGVRVCGLQVWDAKSQTYIFRDKYYGRDLKAGSEFQGALERFLYDGVDRASILRHIPTVLEKLRQLEVIIRRLDGYRFYAASLLMFYDGDTSQDDAGDNDTTTIEDSTTDFATDTEDVYQNGSAAAAAARKKRRNKREIDFKMADFANSVTPATLGDPPLAEKPCPPQHPGEPDRGFLRGLRSLRRYFLKIQRETREELGLGLASAAAGHRSGGAARGIDGAAEDYYDQTGDEYSGDEGCVSE